MKHLALIATLGFAIALAPAVRAHCDGLDGPVVLAARKALETGEVKHVLIWVQKSDEKEMRAVFEHALAVRKLGDAARELADRFFFETLVRVHRAGEGAPYTGLKPAGRDLGPAIPAADRALREGTAEPVVELLTHTLKDRVHEHFAAALKKRDFRPDDIAAGRAFVKAYVEFIHCVEGIYEKASKAAHGHFDDTAKPHHPGE